MISLAKLDRRLISVLGRRFPVIRLPEPVISKLVTSNVFFLVYANKHNIWRGISENSFVILAHSHLYWDKIVKLPENFSVIIFVQAVIKRYTAYSFKTCFSNVSERNTVKSDICFTNFTYNYDRVDSQWQK